MTGAVITKSKSNTVDFRGLVPAQAHSKSFQLVNELAPGASLILVNDHEPKLLYYRLETEYVKQFSWRYLERGPTVWRVKIGKRAQAPCHQSRFASASAAAREPSSPPSERL